MKGLEWFADTKKEFSSWPLKKGVRAKFLSALRDLQNGANETPGLKWLSGMSSRVAEIKISGYRLTASCDLADLVCVLTVFKKDSAAGRQTRKHEVALIEHRLKNLKA